MNHNITYDESQIRRDVDTAKVVELLKKWRNERITKGESMRDLINHDDEMICPTCNAIGRIKKRDKSVSDLTIPEFKTLMVDCFEMWKQRELDASREEYDKITTKPIKIEEVFVKDGKTVPQEY